MSKLIRGEIIDINLKIIENDVIVRELSMKTNIIDLPLYRRNWHPFCNDNRLSYVDNCKIDSEYDKWRLEPPRSSIKYCTLKTVALKWISLIR